MDLKQLRALLMVAETGNVTRAAQRLNLVQPAVSRQLRLLEEDMGTELFERGRRGQHGIELTAAGKAMAEYARRILNEVARAKAEISPTQAAVRGIVSIGLLTSTSDLLATDLVAATAQRYPEIRLRISVGYAGHLLEWLEQGDVDMALLYDQKETAALQVKSLLDEGLWVVGPSSAGLHGKKPVALRHVVDQPFILQSAPQGLRALLEQAAASLGLAFRIAAETNALTVQKALVAAGRGWSILPAIAVAEDVAQGRMTAAPLVDPELRRRIVLAVAANRQATAPVRCVGALLLERMRCAVQEGRWISARWLAD